MNNSVFVIGANSTIAKEVIALIAKNNTIITAGRKDCDTYCDINKKVNIPSGIDVVINFVASLGGISDEEISTAVQTNTLGALKICEAAKKSSVKLLINISSIFALLDETSPYYSVYSITKKYADELTRFYCTLNKVPLTILRPSRIYGNNDDFARNQPFLYKIINTAENGDNVVIYGANDAKRNYLHCADLAEIIERVIYQRIEGVYACTYPSNTSLSNIADAAQQIYNRGGHVIFQDGKPDIMDDTFKLDWSFYETISYLPHISIEDGIKRIKQFRERTVK